MQIVQAPRASAILYNLLKSQENTNPWLLPANICPIVPITFFKAGIPFEFVDISAETLHMDLEQTMGRLERAEYGGVLYAHTYGEPSTPNDFFKAIKSQYPTLIVIDDRCLCVPDLEPPQEMFADLTLYSTGYAKIVDLGYGGYAFRRDGLAYHSESLQFSLLAHEEIEYGYKQAIQNSVPYNYIDSNWLQTDAELPTWYDYHRKIENSLNLSLAHRALINEIYASHLPLEIQLPREYQAWRFNIRVENKERVLKTIFSSNVFASSHYASLAGVMAPGNCPQAESLAGEIINLFNDYHFDPQMAELTCVVIMEDLV